MYAPNDTKTNTHLVSVKIKRRKWFTHVYFVYIYCRFHLKEKAGGQKDIPCLPEKKVKKPVSVIASCPDTLRQLFKLQF